MNRYSKRMVKCFVPSCRNTSKNSRDKLFLSIRESMKRGWCSDAKTMYTPGKRMLCCEDHVDLNEDLENYQEWKIMGTRPVLKLTAKLRNQGKGTSSFQTNQELPISKDSLLLKAMLLNPAEPVSSCHQEKTLPSASIHVDVATQYQIERLDQNPSCVSCSECGVLVSTRVFVCVQCVDARMCAACEPHAHASHAVVRLPSTRVYNIVRDLFESLQEQLNCRLRGLHDDAEDELMDDLDDDELDQYMNLPALKKTKRPVVAPSAGQEIMPPEASKVTFKTSPPATPMPTDEPMIMAGDIKEEEDDHQVTADDIKVEEDYHDNERSREWDPLRKTGAEGFMRITSDIVKFECEEETIAEPKLADVREDNKYIKCLEKESEIKRLSNVRGNTVGSDVTLANKPAVKLETPGNTSIECAQASELGSEFAVKIKEEPTEDASTEQVDSTGFIVFGLHQSIKGEDKETS